MIKLLTSLSALSCTSTQNYGTAYSNMAVLNSCPGLEVKVVSNESALPEYADSQATDPHNTVTTYVEVNSDGAFQVHFQFTDGYSCRYGVRVELRLDGHKVDSCLYRRSQLKKDTGHTVAGARSKIGGRWHVSNFQFSQFVLGKSSTSNGEHLLT